MDVKREPVQKILLANQIVLKLKKEVIAGNYVAGGVPFIKGKRRSCNA